MHVLLVAPSTSIHTQKLSALLLEEGCEVTLVDTIEPQDTTNSRMRFVPFLPVKLPGQGFRLIGYLNRTLCRSLARRIWKDIRPDIVNVHWLDHRAEAFAGADVGPLVLSIWGSDINQASRDPDRSHHNQNVISRSLCKAHGITADSNEVFRRCDQIVGQSLKRINFHFGIDSSLFKPGYDEEARSLRRSLGIPTDSKVIFSSRRLHRNMGQFHILEAFARINGRAQTQDVVLAFSRYLAESDAFEAELRQAVKRHSLEKKVLWLDPAPYSEVPVHYAMADVVVNYPEFDAMPVSLFEAAACGRPIVSIDLAVYREIFGETIHWVSAANPELLAETIQECLLEPSTEKQRRMVQARQIALDVGDSRTNCRRLVHFFSELANAN